MNSRRLFLSRIDEGFDPTLDIAAGPWCFISNEDAIEGWEDLPFIEPFSDRQSLTRADTLTRRLANHIAVSMAEKMNWEHGSAYSPAFWRNFLILWTLGVTQGTWRCYRNLELLVERYGNESLVVPILDEDPAWPITTFSNFMDLLTTDAHFHFWLSSLALRRIAPKGWTLEPVSGKAEASTGRAEMTLQPPATLNRNPLKAFLGRLGFDHVTGTKYSRPFFGLLVNLLPRRTSEARKVDTDKTVLAEFPKDYIDTLTHVLEATRPTAFASDFKQREKEAKVFHYSPGRLTVTHASSIDATLQLINALAVEAGERLIGSQHGGIYGTALAVPWAAEGEYVHHAFITWGWTRQGDNRGRMVPLPSPALSRIRNKHRFAENEMIFVGAKMFVQNGRIDSSPSPKQCLNYRKKKQIFISTLDQEPLGSLVYRPFSRAVQLLEEVPFLKKNVPGLRIFLGPLENKILSCRLLVLDHPGTTLHQAMAANIPVVCFWDADEWPLCSQADADFEPLRECGILFDNPVNAARHVNGIWANVPAWWNSEEVQNARRAWAKTHARTSPVWWWHWAMALWKLSLGREAVMPALKQPAKGPLL